MHRGGVLRNHQVLACRQVRAGGEGEADAAVDRPAGKVDRGGTEIVQFHKLDRLALLVRARMDLIDDDRFRQRARVRRAERDGVQPHQFAAARTVGPAAERHAVQRTAEPDLVDKPLRITRRVGREQPHAFPAGTAESESQLASREHHVSAGGNDVPSQSGH